MSSTSPSWPSLYNPGLEILHIQHRPAVQPGGAYLYDANDIFRFTFYWTLIFYMPFFIVCGFYAFFNYTIPPHRVSSSGAESPLSSDQQESLEQEYGSPHDHGQEQNNSGGTYVRLQLLRSRSHRSPQFASSQGTTPTPRSTTQETLKRRTKNARRSRVTFSLLVLLVFLALGLAGAVIGSAVLGFAVMGLYRAGKFNMSTWIPFLIAVIQVLIGLLSLWPSVIEII